MKFRCFVIILFLIYAASIKAAYIYDSLSEDQKIYWNKITHYENKNLFNSDSLVDSHNFFLSKIKSSRHELESTIISLKKDKNYKIKTLQNQLKHPQCVFPERLRFIENDLNIKIATKVNCNEFVEWKNSIGTEGISLIFSSYYSNNPASLFGHIFIKFKNKSISNLLDYTVSFSAVTDSSDIGLFYAYKGLTGGYKGLVSVGPYYMKVNEYNNSESRDLYEYKLNLDSSSIERILNHIWELYTTAYFDYYFLDENCAYIVSKIIEIGNPKWNLGHVNRPYYLPADIIKNLTKYPQSVNKLSVRSSNQKRVEKLYKSLTAGQKKSVILAIDELNNSKDQSNIKNINNLKVLDTLISYYDYEKVGRKKYKNKKFNRILRMLLMKRSKIYTNESISGDNSLSKRYIHDNPMASHDSMKLSIGGVHEEGSINAILSYKLGYHDLLDVDTGMSKFSEFNLLNVEIKKKENKVKLNQLKIINITSLSPYSFFNRELSWRVGVEMTSDNIYCNDCNDCKIGRGYAGGGATFEVSPINGLFYIMSGIQLDYHTSIKNNLKTNVWAEYSLLSSIKNKYKIIIKQRVVDDVFNYKSSYYLMSSIQQSYSISNNSEIRFNVNYRSQLKKINLSYDKKYQLQLGIYF